MENGKRRCGPIILLTNGDNYLYKEYCGSNALKKQDKNRFDTIVNYQNKKCAICYRSFDSNDDYTGNSIKLVLIIVIVVVNFEKISWKISEHGSKSSC